MSLDKIEARSARPPLANRVSVHRCTHSVWLTFYAADDTVIAQACMPPATAEAVCLSIGEFYDDLTGQRPGWGDD